MYKIKVTAYDMTLHVSDIFYLNVGNKKPEINSKIVNEIPNGRVDSSYSFKFEASTFFD